ncbi:hypothetical protein MPL1032_240336 [Mesorhizobium plurifarium]|uniref:Uncharacterized protein n=1 Tax=Mesorhizobium plurifarium TaxID=69974 RepID=A0A0K2W1K8_MESPL|nr:hypothetical protein MPL1032_240336 [Mesorhizobium plurifarium]
MLPATSRLGQYHPGLRGAGWEDFLCLFEPSSFERIAECRIRASRAASLRQCNPPPPN